MREKIIAEAWSWLKTPYHHHARIKGIGVDCAQFLIGVFSAVGIIPMAMDVGDYSTQWHLHRDEEKFLEWLVKLCREVESPDIGDIAIWKFGRCFSHGSIVVGENLVIHSYIGQGCILGEMDKQPLLGRQVKYFSPIGLQ